MPDAQVASSAIAAFPIEKVRRQSPSLERAYRGKPVAYLDGPGGCQVCRGAIDAMCECMEQGGANLHGQFPTSHETEALFDEARSAVADLVGGKKEEVAFGSDMTSVTFSISRALWRVTGSRVTRSSSPRWTTTPTSTPGWQRRVTRA